MPQVRALTRPRAKISSAQIAVGGLLFVTIAFLTVGPIIERRWAIDALISSQDQAQLEQSMHLVCKNVEGTLALNHALPKASLERRLKVAQVAASLGCLSALKPAYQAEYLLRQDASLGLNAASHIALGATAVEPAILALESELLHQRQRAIATLLGLSESLNEDQRRRVLKRLDAQDLHPQTLALRQALGAGPTPSPAPAPVVPQHMELELPSLGQSLEPGPTGRVLFDAKTPPKDGPGEDARQGLP